MEEERDIQLDRREYEYLTSGKKRGGSGVRAGKDGRGAVIDCGLAKGSTMNTSKDSETDTSTANRSVSAKVNGTPQPVARSERSKYCGLRL